MPVRPPRHNRLLASLPAGELKRLEPDLEWVELEFKQVLFDVDLPIEERCARWLLMTRDRVDSDTFPITQQFLSQMLGVRRASVSGVAAVLQDEGLIRYSRGFVTVLDPEGLCSATCECYGIIREEFDRLLEPGPKRGGPPPGRLLKPMSKEGKSMLGDGTPRPRPRRKVRRKKPTG